MRDETHDVDTLQSNLLRSEEPICRGGGGGGGFACDLSAARRGRVITRAYYIFSSFVAFFYLFFFSTFFFFLFYSHDSNVHVIPSVCSCVYVCACACECVCSCNVITNHEIADSSVHACAIVNATEKHVFFRVYV